MNANIPVNYIPNLEPREVIDPDACDTTASPAPVSEGSIKYHVDETGKLLRETGMLLDRLIEFLWTENDVAVPCTVDVRDLNSAVINNYVMATGVHDRVLAICDHIGLVM